MDWTKFIFLIFGIVLMGCYFDAATNYHPHFFANLSFGAGGAFIAAALSKR